MKKEIATLLRFAPETVKVGAYPWKVVYQDAFLTGDDDKKKWGLCDFANHRLSIGNIIGMPSKEMLVGIFFHELMHAIYSNYNLKNKDTEENVIMAFEAGFMQVFKDNPDVLKFIQKGVS